MAFSLPTFAACVSIPSCNFQRNLATKTNHKATITARTTQHVDQTSFFLAPPPSPLIQRNGAITRRGLKTIVDVAPETAQISTTGYTEGWLKIYTGPGYHANLTDEHNWQGFGKFPETIVDGRVRHFINTADRKGSIGCVVYTLYGHEIPVLKWVIAWYNQGYQNKVYTKIWDADKQINFDVIKASLDGSKSESSDPGQFGYSAYAYIDENTHEARMFADLRKL